MTQPSQLVFNCIMIDCFYKLQDIVLTTSTKLKNFVDIVALQFCISDINIQEIFVIFSSQIKNIMKLPKLSLDLYRLHELNKT